ncbi:MAG TPA: DUF6249 domain-containing protein [Bacteroidota bacterium]|nr:DUF6249 domain-containing protein [Bacteroidota bacterium]
MEGGIFIVIFFFITVLLIWGGTIISRHKERMSIIEKGLGADDMKALYSTWARPSSPLSSLKWGILLVMVGLAIILGVWLHSLYFIGDGIIPGLIAVFGGLGLLLFYRIASKKEA